MKQNYIHVCFIIDESGSMFNSTTDVVEGFKKVIDEQKSIKDGTCSISLYKFNDNVNEIYIGKDINEVELLKKGEYGTYEISSINFLYKTHNDPTYYFPEGNTAMFDGIGTSIDNIGVWLSNMPEEERPEKNLIVIMTDGMENSSKKYTEEMVRNRIQHQTEKYSWTFVYMGTDITTREYANNIGIQLQSYSDRDNYINNYNIINDAASAYRSNICASAEERSNIMKDCLNKEIEISNCSYFDVVGEF